MPLPKLVPALPGFALTAALLLSGCQNPQVNAAVDEIAETFGGRVAAKTGYAASTNDQKQSGKYVEMELSGSTAEISKLYDGNWRLPAAYCAFLVYQHAGQAYDFVRVSFKDADQDHTYSFKTGDLVTVQRKLSRLNLVFTDLQTTNCQQAYSYFNRQAAAPPDIDKLCQFIQGYVAKNGQGSFNLRGFELDTAALGGRTLQVVTLTGVAKYPRKQLLYHFTFDVARDTADVVGLRF